MRVLLERGLRYSLSLIFILIIISSNIMKVVNVRDIVAVNIALSDLIIPFAVILLLSSFIVNKSIGGFRYILIMMLLIVWLIITSLLGDANKFIVSNSWVYVVSEWIKTFACIVYFYIGYQIPNYVSVKWIFRYYSVGYFIFLSYGYLSLYALRFEIDIPILQEKVSNYFLGTYHDPNHAATYITISFFILLCGVQIEKLRCYKFFYLVLILVSFGTIFLTDSRAGLVGFVVALLVFCIVSLRNHFRYIITMIWSLMLAFFSVH